MTDPGAKLRGKGSFLLLKIIIMVTFIVTVFVFVIIFLIPR